MRILVAEPKWTGHHLPIARVLASTLRGAGHEVVLAVTVSDDEVARRMTEVATADVESEGIELRRSLRGPPIGWSRIGDSDGRIEVNAISGEIERTSPDRVVVPSGDATVFHLGGGGIAHELLDSEEARFLLHQPYVGYRGRGLRFAVKRELIRRRLRRSRGGLAGLDHRIGLSLGKRNPVTLLPAPPVAVAELPRRAARTRFGIDDDRQVFLAIGEHSTRKGTERLVEAWPADGSGTLLLVGRCSSEVRESIASRPTEVASGAIRVVDEVVDGETYAAAFHACDVVTACYPRHFGASGILTTALLLDRPILGSDYGYIGDCIESFGLGTTVDCMDPEALGASIRRSLEEPPVIDPTHSRAFREFHAPANFDRHVQMWVLGRTADDIPPSAAPEP